MTDLIQRLIRWPLWSWRNLTVTIFLALVVLGALGRVSAALSMDETRPAAAPSAAAPATTAVPSPRPTSTAPSTSAAQAEPAPASTVTGDPVRDCAEAADLFVRAWARPSLTSTAWLAGLTPYAAHSLLDRLATTDPARVPATQVLTDPQHVKDSGPGEAFRVVTDADPVIVHAVKTDGVCVIRDVEPDNDVRGAPTPRLGPSTTAAPATAPQRLPGN